MLQENLHLSADSFVWGLGGMCELHRLPFAPALVLAQAPPPYTLESIREAAAALGLKTALRVAGPADLATLPLPCLVVLGSANAEVKPAPSQKVPSPSEGEGQDGGAAVQITVHTLPSFSRVFGGNPVSLNVWP